MNEGRISTAGVVWLVVAAGLLWLVALRLGTDETGPVLNATEEGPARERAVVGGPERDDPRSSDRSRVEAGPLESLPLAEPSSRVSADRETHALLVLRVVDRESGEELSGYRLLAGDSIYLLSESLQRTTEALPEDRTYRIRPDRERIVVLYSEGYASAQFRFPATSAGARFHHTLELSGAAQLRFDVVDRGGNDVQGVRVFLCDGKVDAERLIRTGGRQLAEGFVFPMRRSNGSGWEYRAAPTGDLYLHAGLDGELVGSLWIPDLEAGETRSGLVLRVDVVQSAALVVHLRESELVPRGAVILEGSKIGEATPEVDLPGPGGDRRLSYRDVKPGQYRLLYEPHVPSAPERVRPERILLDELDLAAGDERTLEFDVTARTPPTQRVRLLLNGEAVVGQYVYALRRTGSYLHRRSAGRSDAEGVVELPALTAGVTTMQVEMDGRPPAVFPDLSLDAAAGVIPDLELKFSAGSLFLVDAESEAPLADTEVAVWPAGGYSVTRRFRTDSTGRLDLEAADGDLFVRIADAAGALGAPFHWSHGVSEPGTLSLRASTR